MQTIEGYQISFQQKRLWQLQEESDPLRAQVAIRLQGKLNPEKLKTVIETITQQTDILRTTFQQTAGIKFPLQVIQESSKINWEFLNLETESATEQAQKIEEIWQQQTPDHPLKATLIQFENYQHLLLLKLPRLCAEKMTVELLDRSVFTSFRMATGTVSRCGYELLVKTSVHASATVDVTEPNS